MAQDSLSGQAIGGYKVESEIGRGGMGVVYRARDTNLQRVVALKVLAPQLASDETFVKRFVREARAVAQLSHPNIVTVYQAGGHQGVYYMAMEYVEGKSLAASMGLPGQLDVVRALDITLQAARALEAAHAKGIVHRDINPRNIMVDETGRVRVLDFGLAKLLQGATALTSDGSAPGTPAYMAPEQVDGSEVDVRTDIYSLGATLYEMLTGRVPYQANTPLGVMRAIAEQPFPILALNDLVAHPVVQLVSKMTTRNPDFRYPSAQAVCADIGHLLKDPATVRARFVLDKESREDIVTGPSVDFEDATSVGGKAPAAMGTRETAPCASPPGTAEEPRRAEVPKAAAATPARPGQTRLAFAVGASLVAALAAVVIGVVLFAGGGPASEDGWIPLFNGKNLDGWKRQEELRMHTGTPNWEVHEGALVTTGEKNLLRTVSEWQDYELQIDYMAHEGTMGSLWLRGRVPLVLAGRADQPNKGQGAVYAQHAPLANAAREAKQWNHLEVRLEGDRLTAHLNDTLIHDNVQVTLREGYVDPFGGFVTDAGPIVIQAWTGMVRYRNLRIRPIEGQE